MSADPTSPQALFAAAQDVARQLGQLNDHLASQEHCRITSQSFVLNDSQGTFITRVPMAKVRQMAQSRHKLLMRIQGSREVAQISRVRQIDRRTTFRKQPDHIRALAWALSDGRRIPQGAFRPRDWWIGVGLLLVGVIPGVIYLMWARLRHRQYLADVQALVVRWHGQHRPDPSDAWFESLGN